MVIDQVKLSLWDRYRTYLCAAPEVGFRLDVSRVRFTDEDFARLSWMVAPAMDAMERLEAGAIANPDENRMVGHYWLRAPELAPAEELRSAIQRAVELVESVAEMGGASSGM
jgi:glucose-6-phosphate isomerase